jgi:Berberine and berberine like
MGSEDAQWTAQPRRSGAKKRPGRFRDAKWVQVIVGVDPEPANAAQLRDWAVGYSEAIEPYSMNGTYLNMIMDEGQERVQASYRENYPRLAKLKATYDPRTCSTSTRTSCRPRDGRGGRGARRPSLPEATPTRRVALDVQHPALAVT